MTYTFTVILVQGYNNKIMKQNKEKLEKQMIKQEMARVNINILGISELKWTRMG